MPVTGLKMKSCYICYISHDLWSLLSLNYCSLLSICSISEYFVFLIDCNLFEGMNQIFGFSSITNFFGSDIQLLNKHLLADRLTFFPSNKLETSYCNCPISLITCPWPNEEKARDHFPHFIGQEREKERHVVTFSSSFYLVLVMVSWYANLTDRQVTHLNIVSECL